MKLRYRTVFISDVHLGSRGSRAKDLQRFLKRVRCRQLYLVGDIIDMWLLKRRWYWPNEHNDVVRRILRIAKRKKTEVIFLPGNHDDAARQYHQLEFGGVQCKPYAVHVTADGRKLLVVHGDQFDLVVKHHRMLSVLGGLAYEWLLTLNRYYNAGRRMLGMPYLSLSQAIKLKVKRACTYMSHFEETLIDQAKRQRMDGVVCGHIHKAEIRVDEATGIEYYNCGDWVESCTILVEHDDGRMEIIDGLEVVAKEKDRADDASDIDAELHEPDGDEEPEGSGTEETETTAAEALTAWRGELPEGSEASASRREPVGVSREEL